MSLGGKRRILNMWVFDEVSLRQKSDSLGKLYEMDDDPERRGWVERLLAFMEERRTPIAACPTISKQPLDLYRLYLLVHDRGGFVEVLSLFSFTVLPCFKKLVVFRFRSN